MPSARLHAHRPQSRRFHGGRDASQTASRSDKGYDSNVIRRPVEERAHDGRSAADMLDTVGPGQILLADRAYDSDALRQSLADRGAWANIKPISQRLRVPAFSPYLYRFRNLVDLLPVGPSFIVRVLGVYIVPVGAAIAGDRRSWLGLRSRSPADWMSASFGVRPAWAECGRTPL
jgi:hypothetical protein